MCGCRREKRKLLIAVSFRRQEGVESRIQHLGRGVGLNQEQWLTSHAR